MESLVLDHDKPGSGDDIPTASTSSSVKSSKVVDIEQERLMEDFDKDESASVSVESGGCQTIVPLSSESEQTHNSSDKVNQSPLVQRRAIQDQVDTEIELERIGDSDEDTLLGGDNDQSTENWGRISPLQCNQKATFPVRWEYAQRSKFAYWLPKKSIRDFK